MAHTCPDCDQTCYCNGDIGNTLLNDEETFLACTHWKKCSDEYNNPENYEMGDCNGEAPNDKVRRAAETTAHHGLEREPDSY